MRSPPFFMHTKPQAGAARIGAWQAECAADIYDPIVRHLAVPAAGVFPAIADAAALQALCNANIPTLAQAGTNNAFCDAQLSVTENTGAKALSKLGSSTWYNYLPVPIYATVGGFIDVAFAPAGLAGFLSLPAGTTDVQALAATNVLLRPTFQDTVMVNYFKSYLPAGSL